MMKKLWRGSLYDGLVILFLGWLYGVSIINFDWIAWTLIAIGALLTVLSIAGSWQKIFEYLKSRKIRISSNAIIVIILVLGIVGMLNYLSVHHSWRVDTTSQKEFSLSDQTIKILRNLEEEVKLTAFVEEVQFKELEDRLTEYGHYSSKFDYELIDPIKEPDRVREFYGPERTYLDLPTVVLKTSLKDEQINSLSEEDITNALIKVTRKEKRKVYFTWGHGEKTINPDQPGMDSYQFVRENLEKQYFDVESLNLFETNEVPEDGDVVVVAGPTEKLAKSEVTALGKFLEDGGNVLVLIDPETNPGLDSLLEEWNVKLNQDMVLESHSSFVLTSRGLSRQSNVSIAPTSAEYGDHTITKNFRYATSYVKAQSLDILDEDNESIEAVPLVKTSRSSWGETDLASLFQKQRASIDDNDNRGPTQLAYAIEKTTGKKGRMVVVGDSDFASDAYVQQAPGNMDFFLNSVSWLAEEEDLISVRPKNPENRPLEMSLRQQKLTLFFLIIFLPLLAIRWGLYTYQKRS